MAKFLIIRNPILRDAIGLFLLGVAMLMAISLVSYRYIDPPLVAAGTTDVLQNWGGVVGVYLADYLLVYFGIAAYLFVPLFFILAVHFFRKEGIPYVMFDIVCGVFIALSAITILGLVFEDKGLLFHRTISTGGTVGFSIASALRQLFNTAGSLVLAGIALILFLIILLGISMGELISGTGKILAALWRTITSALSRKTDKKAEPPVSRKRENEPKATMPKVQVDEDEPDEDVPGADEGHTKKGSQPPRIETTKKETPPGGNAERREVRFTYENTAGVWRFPSIDLLSQPDAGEFSVNRETLITTAKNLENKLADFGVKGRVTEVRPGPIITLFEFEPAAGERINKIVALDDDIAMAMSALSVRIIAPIPGKSVVGFEIPNETRQTVRLREIIGSDRFEQSRSKLTCALGKDIYGNPVVTDLAKMPHLLVAGATGAGKSVCINTMILSFLYKATPEEVRFLLIDPKMLELSLYKGIPHLLLPVVTDPKEAAMALRWVVEEMERRYRVMAQLGVKNIAGYAAKIETLGKEKGAGNEDLPGPMPFLVVIIDELADLMMTSSKEVEESITRLAHMARASGIHLILATQRPSVNVLTGVIKANFPARMSFQVASRVDSRTILDTSGAEHLLGKGDMLFLPPATSRLVRVHGAYVSEEDIGRVVEFVKGQAEPKYEEIDLRTREDTSSGSDGEYDEKYDEAVAFIAETGKASISLIQRHLRVGYNRAARIIEKMEEDGIVGPSDGIKPREVFINKV